jgi:hypothetical protein
MAFSVIFIIILVLFQLSPTAPAQAPVNSLESQRSGGYVENLRIRVLEGEGAVHNIRTGAATAAVVEVRDADDRPLEGAEVTFQLPKAGAGGMFAGDKLSLSVKTNFQGQAAAFGFQPNKAEGNFRIDVTAVFGSFLGRTRISQTNSSSEFISRQPIRRSRKRLWLVVLGAAGGGALTYFLVRGGPSISLSSQPVTVGAPR